MARKFEIAPKIYDTQIYDTPSRKTPEMPLVPRRLEMAAAVWM